MYEVFELAGTKVEEDITEQNNRNFQLTSINLSKQRGKKVIPM